MKISDTQFKANVESIQPEMFDHLRLVKADKTLSKHLDRIKGGRFEKSEIGAITKLLQSIRFEKTERKNAINAFRNLAFHVVDHMYIHSDFQADVLHFGKPAKISKEQTELGKQWLRNHFFKLDGSPRKGKATEDVSDRVLAIAKSVSKFEFVGVLEGRNAYGDVCQVLPIYRTYDRKGNYFDYSPIHWGQPVIMESL